MKNKKGFTLAELLIVVAIIGVLVAISIPVFGGQLEKARVAVDQANVRSAKAAAVAEYLAEGVEGNKIYYYDRGTVYSENPGNIAGYGKSTQEDADGKKTGARTIDGSVPEGGYVSVIVSSEYEVIAMWCHGGSGLADGAAESISGNAGSGTSGGFLPVPNARDIGYTHREVFPESKAEDVQTTPNSENVTDNDPVSESKEINASDNVDLNDNEISGSIESQSNETSSDSSYDTGNENDQNMSENASEDMEAFDDETATVADIIVDKTMKWDDISKEGRNNWGNVQIPMGTVVSDGINFYANCGHSYFYIPENINSLQELAELNTDRLIKFELNQNIRVIGDDLRNMRFSGGEIIQHNNQYYVTRETDYSKNVYADPITVEHETYFFVPIITN